MDKQMQPEILAPAGGQDALRAAVNAGADAVYFGIGQFNARAKAENFSADSLKDTVDFCHVRGVKAYLALNTLIKDADMEFALEIARTAKSCKIDAIIVQDWGLARKIKSTMSDIVLHASTQAGIHNLEGAMFLEDCGFDRVIVSRETRLEDIALIRSRTGLEVESFVQGALCVAFSGNCYFSSLAAGQSGNSGRCLQLCRKKFEIFSNGQQLDCGHLLSTKDLCALDRLKELVEAGVCCFKIEGRLRRVEYVAGATLAYRAAVDNNFLYLSRNKYRLKKLYNRGDYVSLRPDDDESLIFKQIPNHIGVEVARVARVAGGRIITDNNYRFGSGDGIKILREGIEVGNALVSNPDKITFVGDAEAGDSIRLTTDSKLNRSLNELPERKREITVNISLQKGKLCMTAQLGADIASETIDVAPAQNSPLTKNTLRELANKTDLHPFAVRKIDVVLNEAVFTPKSALNAMRRTVYAELYKTVAENYLVAQAKNAAIFDVIDNADPKNISGNFEKTDADFIINFTDFAQVQGAELPSKTIFAYSPPVYNQNASRIIDLATMKNCYLNLPNFASGADIKVLRYMIPEFAGVIVNNAYGITLAREFGKPFIGGALLNIANAQSGITNFVASVELNRGEARASGATFIYAFGKFPLMTLVHCPRKAAGKRCGSCDGEFVLNDSRASMLLERVKLHYCYHRLLNGVPIDLLGESSSGKYVDLTGYSAEDAQAIIVAATKARRTDMQSTKGYWTGKT